MRPELSEAFDSGDFTRMRRVLSHHIAEAEDPAALLRLLDRATGRSGEAGTTGIDRT